MPGRQRPAPTPSPSVAPTTQTPAPAADARATDANALGNTEMQARMQPASPDGASLLDTEAAAPVVTHEVSQRVTETISNAPDPYGAWNGQFGWDSKFQLVIDPNASTCTIVVRIHTGASEEVRRKWETAIESKWGGKYALHVAPETPEGQARSYAIGCDLQWVEDASNAHFQVTANEGTADEGGRAGLGGTTSMTGWGVDDEVDVTHEFGHMLGAVEDYFTTNGEDHTHGGERAGFRDEGGGIMNNPSDDPFTEHYELIRVHAAQALGVDQSRCTVR